MNEQLSRWIYNSLLPVAAGAGYTAALFHSKLREALKGRRNWRERWADAGGRLRERPVWFHVSSVGEFEQARPLITSIRGMAPEIPVVVSFSSPSGFGFANRKEKFDDSNNIKFADYLPADFARNIRFCLNAIDPRLVVFVKFDLWPNLIWNARERDIPVALIDATLSPSSSRNSRVGRSFYRSVYSNIQKILAISETDATRFREVVSDHPHISVTGDTRFDRVMERKLLKGEIGFDLPREGRKIIICGSTWPRDENHLLPALESLMQTHPDLTAVIAPHEPAPERVASLVRWAKQAGLSQTRVSKGIRGTPPRVVLLDTVGILAEVYRLGDVAYIGGSFSTGVHSVIEPAIEKMPVLFGPVHDNSFEALRLIECGAGFAVANGRDIRSHLEDLLYDKSALRRAGEAAARYVQSQLGATEKCMAAIEEYL
jgi:3-deoxy-D-manno-octulosonic-acid transferase